jgi:hypothetical protein
MFPINQEIWNVFVAMHLRLTEQFTTKLMPVGQSLKKKFLYCIAQKSDKWFSH